MSFLSPYLLFALIGMALPVAAHLQGRKRAKRKSFAAIEFLLASDKKLAKRLILRQRLLLFFRVLICGLLALVFAKPVASCESEGPQFERGPQAVAIVIDDSALSGYEFEGRSLLVRSREAAIELVRQAGTDAEIAIVRTSNPRESEMSRDHLGMRERLATFVPSLSSGKVGPALARAQELLDAADHEIKRLYFFGVPVQGRGWEETGTLRYPLQLVHPAPGHEFTNLGIDSVSVFPDSKIGGRGLRVVASVYNGGAREQKAALALRVGSEPLARGDISVSPGQTKEKTFSIKYPTEGGGDAIVVSLEDDALKVDNTHYALSGLSQQVRALLINGDPSTLRHEDELYFVEAALRPGDRGDSGIQLKTSSPENFAAQDLEEVNAVVLANVASLDQDARSKLEAWVRKGGGLLIAMGDKVRPETYNKEMANLLAQSLASPLDLRWGNKGQASETLRLDKLEAMHPIFSVFQSEPQVLTDALFFKIMLLGPTTEVRNRRVLARYDNGAAALVEARLGEGHLLLFTSTLDRDWNNLPIHSGYLPWLQRTLAHLSSRPNNNAARSVRVGTSVTIPLVPDDQRLEVSGPEERIVLEGEKVEGRNSTRFERTDLPGLYRVTAFDKSGQELPRAESSFVVNVPEQVGVLRPIAPSLSEELGIDAPGGGGKNVRKRRVELWHALAALLLLALFAESALSYYRGRMRAKRATS